MSWALKFGFTNTEGIVRVETSYSSLNNPYCSIPKAVTQLTGITNEAGADQHIDWQQVGLLLNDCDLVICHNSHFDRKCSNFKRRGYPPLDE